jgi:hypothetical protein
MSAAVGRSIPSIASQRLQNQCITRPRSVAPGALVAAFGAVQSQEYPFAKWALALRLARSATDAYIDRAFDRGDILRTHVLRPTWHFVAAADIRWMLQLTAPRVHARLAVYMRHLGLDTRTLTKAMALLERTVGGSCPATRQELRTTLARAGITTNALQLSMIMMHAELEQVVCSGPRRQKQFTYALLSERAPTSPQMKRDETLAELARRYFASHGPATARDFVWWSSLTTADARRGLAMINAHSFEQDGLTYWTTGPAKMRERGQPSVHLLPIYDEFLVAYRDRVAVPAGPSTYAMGPMKHALVIGGHVVGTWTTDRTSEVRVTAARRLSAAEGTLVEAEAHRFGRFLGVALRVVFEFGSAKRPRHS